MHSWQRVSTLDFAAHKIICKKIRAANIPVLVAWTKDDHLIEHEVAQAAADALTPGPRYAFETGGHMLVKSRAVEIAKALDEFIV